MRRDRTQTQALQKMINFYFKMVDRTPRLVEGGYRLAACVHRQPAASLLDLRSVAQHSADRGPLGPSQGCPSIPATPATLMRLPGLTGPAEGPLQPASRAQPQTVRHGSAVEHLGS